MDALEVLTQAKAILSAKKRWTKGKFARDALGETADPNSEEAMCFCIEGALRRSAGKDFAGENWPALLGARDAIRDSLPEKWLSRIYDFNDSPGTEHENVLALFDRAIAKIEVR